MMKVGHKTTQSELHLLMLQRYHPYVQVALCHALYMYTNMDLQGFEQSPFLVAHFSVAISNLFPLVSTHRGCKEYAIHDLFKPEYPEVVPNRFLPLSMTR
jgi:hypothetical protein